MLTGGHAGTGVARGIVTRARALRGASSRGHGASRGAPYGSEISGSEAPTCVLRGVSQRSASSPVIGPRELARRERALRRWIGGQVRDLREDLGLTRADLARGAGLDRAHICRIELGTVSASQGALLAIAATLGADLGVRLFPGAGPPIRDRFQAPIVESISRAVDRSWAVRPEVPVGKPSRGVIDLVIVRGRIAIACEVQSELRRLEEALRRAGEKESVLADEVPQENTSRLLVIRSTVATREIARRFEATLAAAYPARSADAYDALTTGDRPWPGPAILWARLEKGRAEILRLPSRGVAVGR